MYAGKIPKNYIKISVPEASTRPKGGHRAARGQPGGCLARPSPWPRHLPPGWVPHPLVPYFGPIYSPDAKPPKKKALFQSTSRSHRNPLFFSGRANLEAALASDEGEIIAIVIIITSPSPLHDFSHHV